MRRTTGEGGFSLLEVMISVALFAGMALAVASLMVESQQGFEYSIIQVKNNDRVKTALAATSSRMKEGLILGVEEMDQSQPAVVFQAAVDWDADGDVIDADGNVEWGAETKQQIILGGVYVLHFEPLETTAEASKGYDYNGDGDETDVFQWGRLRLKVFQLLTDAIDTGNLVYTTSNALQDEMIVDGLFTGTDANNANTSDIDGDGQIDRMFDAAVSGGGCSRMDMKFGTFQVDSSKTVVRTVRIESVKMRNPQSEGVTIFDFGS